MESLPQSIVSASKEAVQQILPDKSYNRYICADQKFLQWEKSQETDLFDEEVLLAYFNEAAKTYKPTTLWSTYSMLKNNLNCNHNVDIAKYARLIAFLKKKKDGFQCKKSEVLTAGQMNTFLDEAPDSLYLGIKAVTVFGLCGACRGDGIVHVTTSNVTDYGSEIIVPIPDSKTKVPKVYPINGSFAEIVRRYMQQRPQKILTDRFFLQYRDGKCTAEVIGKNSVARKIVEYLGLPDAVSYTGHSFRRTSTTILADTGVGIETIKRHGAWKSTSVAEGYIQESLGNKRKILGQIATATVDATVDENLSPTNDTESVSKKLAVQCNGDNFSLSQTIAKKFPNNDRNIFNFSECENLTINFSK